MNSSMLPSPTRAAPAGLGGGGHGVAAASRGRPGSPGAARPLANHWQPQPQPSASSTPMSSSTPIAAAAAMGGRGKVSTSTPNIPDDSKFVVYSYVRFTLYFTLFI